MTLRRFWLEFAPGESEQALPIGVRAGCGVTAFDEEDALALAKERVFHGAAVPRLARLVPDIDVSTLDAGHILPNLGDVLVRGIWFPKGHE